MEQKASLCLIQLPTRLSARACMVVSGCLIRSNSEVGPGGESKGSDDESDCCIEQQTYLTGADRVSGLSCQADIAPCD